MFYQDIWDTSTIVNTNAVKMNIVSLILIQGILVKALIENMITANVGAKKLVIVIAAKINARQVWLFHHNRNHKFAK